MADEGEFPVAPPLQDDEHNAQEEEHDEDGDDDEHDEEHNEDEEEEEELEEDADEGEEDEDDEAPDDDVFDGGVAEEVEEGGLRRDASAADIVSSLCVLRLTVAIVNIRFLLLWLALYSRTLRTYECHALTQYTLLHRLSFLPALTTWTGIPIMPFSDPVRRSRLVSTRIPNYRPYLPATSYFATQPTLPPPQRPTMPSRALALQIYPWTTWNLFTVIY